MDFAAKFSAPESVTADWLVVGVWEVAPLSGAAEQIDNKLDGFIGRLLEAGDVTGKHGEVIPLLQCPALQAKRLLLVGLGKKDKADLRSLHTAAVIATRHLTTKKFGTLAFIVPEPVNKLETPELAGIVALGVYQGSECSGIRKSEPDRNQPDEVHIIAPSSAPKDEVTKAVKEAAIKGRGVSLTRELVNLPANELYPETFAQRAEEVARSAGFECTVYDEQWLKNENMGSLLGVAQGSVRPPRFVVMKYNGNKGGPTVAFVGKGVTFDSGGLSLKSTDNMLTMKCDMGGAGTVLGALQAIAELKLPVNVMGVLALVENMPGGNAFKLGDVLRARNGKTIEIHNTDAEGRLILADALAYTVEQKVNHLVDLATLTGACVVALGMEVVGLMSNDDDWSRSVQDAAARCGELVWPLPMFPLYGDMIKSKVADIKNTGGSRWAGAISAAKFLEEFVDHMPWVHLDIAGPAFVDDENAQAAAGGSGVMVRTLVEIARSYKLLS